MTHAIKQEAPGSHGQGLFVPLCGNASGTDAGAPDPADVDCPACLELLA